METIVKQSEVFLIRHTDKLIGIVDYWQKETTPNHFVLDVEHASRYPTREEAEEAGKVVRRNHNGLALEIVQIQITVTQLKATELPR
jgi:hypothetical protein